MNEPVQENKRKLPLTVINTNARSLCPKINSLVDCLADMEASIATVTETWFTDGESLEEDAQDLLLRAGLRIMYRNREANVRGFSHGGVAIIYKDSVCSLNRMKLHNPHDFEVIAASGVIKGCQRKIVIIASYIPPNYSVGRGKAAMDFVACLLYTSPSPRD